MSIHHPDHQPYRHFTQRQRVDKAVQTFYGLVRGITIDGELNAEEIAELLNWTHEYSDLIGRAPINELKQKLEEILADGRIDPEEQEDLLWVCRNLLPDSEYFDAVTHDIQQLHGIMHGIMADGRVRVEEAYGLQGWLDDHCDLKGTYPYDELDSLLTSILKDKKIDEQEQQVIASFFEDFIEFSFAKKIRVEGQRVKAGLPKTFTLPGICSMFLGVSPRYFTSIPYSLGSVRAISHLLAASREVPTLQRYEASRRQEKVKWARPAATPYRLLPHPNSSSMKSSREGRQRRSEQSSVSSEQWER